MEYLTPLFTSPLKGLSFLFIILSFVSIWIKRRFGFWLLFFVLSYVCAYYSGIVELRTLAPIGILLLCHLSLTKDCSGFLRLFLVMIASVISFALLTHFLQGFHNIRLASEWKSSPDALPLSLYLNYDKPLIALFILGFSLPLINSKKELLRCLAFTLPAAVVTIATLFFLATYLHLALFEPKIPLLTPLWLAIQIFFVVLPEEIFFRGFLQREITKDLPNRLGAVLAIIVTSLLFTLTFLFFTQNLPFLCLTFIASLFYGTLFEITGQIESSILLHLLVNTTHFLFFTYPFAQ